MREEYQLRFDENCTCRESRLEEQGGVSPKLTAHLQIGLTRNPTTVVNLMVDGPR